MQSELWRRALARYVIPDLPGRWATSGAILYRQPAGWLFRGVVWSQVKQSSAFTINAFVILLASPSTSLHGPHLLDIGCIARTSWESPKNLAEAEPTFRILGELIETHALPFLDRLGTLEAIEADARERIVDSPRDPYPREALFNCQIILGDTRGALETAEWFHAAAAEPQYRLEGDWYRDLVGRVLRAAETAKSDPAEALAVLREHAAFTRAAFKIAPDGTAV